MSEEDSRAPGVPSRQNSASFLRTGANSPASPDNPIRQEAGHRELREIRWGDAVMSKSVTVAQAQIRLLLELVRLVRAGLQGVLADLPPSPEEQDREVDLEGETDVASEVRRVVQCVLADDIEPALADLLAVAEYVA